MLIQVELIGKHLIQNALFLRQSSVRVDLGRLLGTKVDFHATAFSQVVSTGYVESAQSALSDLMGST
jgi:hypothetical protein